MMGPFIPAIHTHYKVKGIDSHIGIQSCRKAEININEYIHDAGRIHPDIFFTGEPYGQQTENNGHEFGPGGCQQVLVKGMNEV